MTNTKAHASPTWAKQKKTLVNRRRLGFCYMSLFIMILFFKNADAAALWVSEGLRLCAQKLIPSLFPFMVISSLAISCGLGELVTRILGRPFQLLFGIEGEGAVAVILGWICGFPVGAKCACELYGSQRISHAECTRLLCICGTPSPAFLISTVGGAMLGSRSQGLCLYLISLTSSLILGVLLKFISPLPERCGQSCAENAPPRSVGIAKSVTAAVCDSARGMLCVCGFVVFFSAFLGVMRSALSFIAIPSTANALLFAFFELTTGLSAIIGTGTALSLPLCALAVGWSGMSVHFQTISICSAPVSFKPYFIAHAAKCALCFVLGLLILC